MRYVTSRGVHTATRNTLLCHFAGCVWAYDKPRELLPLLFDQVTRLYLITVLYNVEIKIHVRSFCTKRPRETRSTYTFCGDFFRDTPPPAPLLNLV